MSQALRKLTGALSKTNCAAIFINQLREKIGNVYGNPEVTTGGRALKFYSSVRIDVRKGEPIKDGSEVIGVHTKAKIVKNKVAPPFKLAEFDILYGKGICHTGEIIDAGVEFGVVKKSGAWFYYGETRLGQGRDNVKKLLEDNAELAKEIEDKITAVMTENGSKLPAAAEEDDEYIMPTEPTARPHKSIDIDIAVDD
jgi:recombination protein RecA